MIPQDKIIEWAREVNAHRYTNRHFPDQPAFAFDIERLTLFANLVAQYQNEELRRTIADDNYAIQFQTLGQYRKALLKL